MTKNEQYNLCRQQQITTVVSQLLFTWLTLADPARAPGPAVAL